MNPPSPHGCPHGLCMPPKPKPSYREIRPMRGRLMRGLPVVFYPKNQLIPSIWKIDWSSICNSLKVPIQGLVSTFYFPISYTNIFVSY